MGPGPVGVMRSTRKPSSLAAPKIAFREKVEGVIHLLEKAEPAVFGEALAEQSQAGAGVEEQVDIARRDELAIHPRTRHPLIGENAMGPDHIDGAAHERRGAEGAQDACCDQRDTPEPHRAVDGGQFVQASGERGSPLPQSLPTPVESLVG
jgi:hypothetical protein